MASALVTLTVAALQSDISHGNPADFGLGKKHDASFASIAARKGLVLLSHLIFVGRDFNTFRFKDVG